MKPTLTDVHQQFAEFFPGRILAPYAYLASKKLSEGHICLDLRELANDIPAMPAAYQRLLTEGAALLTDEPLVAGPGAMQPFILHNQRFYLQRYFTYESRILEGIRRLISAETADRPQRIATLLEKQPIIDALFPPASGQEADWQLAGAIFGAINHFTIITGGPGTGKTTTLARLLAVLYTLEPGLRVSLAAPTGKAAARMAESLQKADLSGMDEAAAAIRCLVPTTLHRLLKPVSDTPHFRHDAQNPLPADMIVVDEASMVDAALLAKLLEATGPQARLILLGDKNQLASVEAGSMLGDLCLEQERINVLDAGAATSLVPLFNFPLPPKAHLLNGHIVELKKSHRFTTGSGIGKLSRDILAGNFEAVCPGPEVVVDHQYDPEIASRFFEGFRAYILEQDIKASFEQFNRLRVLCAVREGEQGVNRMNARIEEYLRERQLIRLNADFYEHRPVIITRNFYDLGLFNGDTGIVRRDAQGVLKAWFPDGNGGMRDILPHYIADAQTVFAMTIHKSQGSEFDRVLVLLPGNDSAGHLTRELLYTAVTRARREVVIQGSEAVIRQAVSTTVSRASGINDRFDEEPLNPSN